MADSCAAFGFRRCARGALYTGLLGALLLIAPGRSNATTMEGDFSILLSFPSLVTVVLV